jgi:cytochrome c-type biogenesis protein CcmE
MKTKSLVLLLLLAASFGGLLYFLSGSFSTYSDFAEAQKTGREVHVVAKWVDRDNAQYDPSTDQFTFKLQDSLKNTVTCIYPDPKPANLENAEKVVIIGKYEGNAFHADKILMKCPSKYKNDKLEMKPTSY